MADEVEPAKKRVNKKLLVIVGAAAAIAVAAVALAATIFSPQAKADKLYEQGSYAEALEAYESIGNESKNGEKMSDCRYQLVLDYLLTNGAYIASEGGATWTVEGFSNGDIKCSLAGNLSEKASIGLESSMVIIVHRGNTVADLTASFKWKVLNRTLSETGSGKIDLPSYTYDKDITLDDYENSGNTTGSSVIKSNSGMVAKMIKKGFLGAVNASGTGATLADLGFTSLS